jgi:rhamnosyltransferase
MSPSVCAVVVTYHPGREFAEHVPILRSQVGGLVVVDNRSSDAERMWLRELAAHQSFTLLENSTNAGIGAALNAGIRWAVSAGFEYVLLLDQDSETDETFVASLISRFREHSASDRVAVVAPQLLNRNTQGRDGPWGVSNRYLVAQTSGSLMPIAVFASEGWFREDLFIDYVDYEYCLRAVTAGWSISYCAEALLRHQPGNSQRHTFHGLYLGTTTNYSALRHYYSTRNGTWLMLWYRKYYPRWCAKNAFLMLKEKIKVVVFENHCQAKLRSSLQGLLDALRGKLGKRDDLNESKEKQ